MAIHYMLKNEDTWNNFKKNINSHLRNGGYMLITTFDGQKVAELLKGTDKYTQEYTDETGKVRTLFEIVKKYQDPANDSHIFGTGNAIDVYLSWISQEGRYITEYLVDSRYMTNDFKNDCDLELIDTDSFGNQMTIHEPYLTYYAKFEDVEETRTYLNRVGGFYKSDGVNDGCKKLNTLYRHYVYRKRDVISKQKGGNDEFPDFSDNTKFVIPSMMGYDNEYSCVNSIHHIMKNHRIIPKSIPLEKFCDDLGIGLVRDKDIDNKLKTIAKSIIVEHSISNDEGRHRIEKTETVIDGLNVFIIERDCNDNYDVDLIKKSKKISSDDKAIILMKEGTWYVPVYYLDDIEQKRVGMYDMNHTIIKQMLENV
jgi:hypothetical protein